MAKTARELMEEAAARDRQRQATGQPALAEPVSPPASPSSPRPKDSWWVRLIDKVYPAPTYAPDYSGVAEIPQDETSEEAKTGKPSKIVWACAILVAVAFVVALVRSIAHLALGRWGIVALIALIAAAVLIALAFRKALARQNLTGFLVCCLALFAIGVMYAGFHEVYHPYHQPSKKPTQTKFVPTPKDASVAGVTLEAYNANEHTIQMAKEQCNFASTAHMKDCRASAKKSIADAQAAQKNELASYCRLEPKRSLCVAKPKK